MELGREFRAGREGSCWNGSGDRLGLMMERGRDVEMGKGRDGR